MVVGWRNSPTACSPRLVVPGQPLHLIHRGSNRQAVFFGKDDYHRFLSDLTQAAGKYQCSVPANVLMINQLHLLVTPGEGGSVSCMMQAMGRQYVRREPTYSGSAPEPTFPLGLYPPQPPHYVAIIGNILRIGTGKALLADDTPSF